MNLTSLYELKAFPWRSLTESMEKLYFREIILKIKYIEDWLT